MIAQIVAALKPCRRSPGALGHVSMRVLISDCAVRGVLIAALSVEACQRGSLEVHETVIEVASRQFQGV